MPPPPEPKDVRSETDRSLRVERKHADAEMLTANFEAAGEALALVEAARVRADAVLENAREKADETLEQAGAPPPVMRALAHERHQEDVEIDQEQRQIASEVAARARALLGLLRHERAQTDHRLLVERARSDAALAARDDFLGMVSHDVRNLLGGIAMTAALQIEHAGSDSVGRQAVAAAERIQRLTRGSTAWWEISSTW